MISIQESYQFLLASCYIHCLTHTQMSMGQTWVLKNRIMLFATKIINFCGEGLKPHPNVPVWISPLRRSEILTAMFWGDVEGLKFPREHLWRWDSEFDRFLNGWDAASKWPNRKVCHSSFFQLYNPIGSFGDPSLDISSPQPNTPSRLTAASKMYNK